MTLNVKMGMLMSISRKVEFRFSGKYYEGEVLEENISGKDLFPEIEQLYSLVYMKVKRDLDGIVFGVHMRQVRELNN